MLLYASFALHSQYPPQFLQVLQNKLLTANPVKRVSFNLAMGFVVRACPTLIWTEKQDNGIYIKGIRFM